MHALRFPRPIWHLLIGVGLVILLGLSLAVGLAIHEYRQAEQLQRQDEATRALEAAVLVSRASTDQLIATLQEFVRQRPEEARGYTLLGGAYLQKARETADPTYYGKADGVLNRAIQLNGDDSDALTNLGELALARHQFSQAVDWGRRSLAVNPYKARTLGVIGDGLIELGRYDEAIETFQQMVDRRPDLSAYARVAYARELFGDTDGAIEAMEAAVKAGAPTAENTAYVQVQLGHLLFNTGRLDEAERAYQAALRTLRTYKPAEAGMARLLAARGDLPRAIALYRDVIDVMPLPEYIIALSELYRVNGQSEAAAQQEALVQAIGQLFQSNGVDLDLELALFDIERGRNLPQAIARSRQALAERPSVKVADLLAWALYQDGQYQAAWEASQQALRLGTHDATLHYHAGLIAAKLGNRTGAITALETALTINPYFSVVHAPIAQRTLTELRQAS